MAEPTKAERLAASLEGMVRAKVLPGLLPVDVAAAAGMLREQCSELKTLRKALATKHHIVNATATREHYRIKVRGEFVIADPQIYFGEIIVDAATAFIRDRRDWELHVARQLTRVATADWIRDMEERAYGVVRAAIATAVRMERDATEIAARPEARARAEGIAQPTSPDPVSPPSTQPF